MTICYYFGCYQGLGHHLWGSPDTPIPYSKSVEIFGKEWRKIDGAFIPKNVGEVAHGDTFATFLPPGWTYLSMIDKTIDYRSGSHSTFLILGQHSKLEAIQLVRVAFPEICKRIGLKQ